MSKPLKREIAGKRVTFPGPDGKIVEGYVHYECLKALWVSVTQPLVGESKAAEEPTCWKCGCPIQFTNSPEG